MALEKTYQQIKDLKIQGATAIARSIIFELKKEGLACPEKGYSRWLSALKDNASFLLSVRPTEPMAQNLSRLLIANIQGLTTVDAGKKALTEIAKEVLQFIDLGQDNIIQYGQQVVKDGDHIMTHCHSSTVEHILVNAKKIGKKIKVFNTETRPLYQGRITAKNLLQNKIDVTMVTDSAAAFLITSHSGKDVVIDKVLIGADVIFSHGSAVNKIGSFNIALAAVEQKIPLYIVAHLLKTDDDGRIEIERRSAKEVWSQAPKGLEIVNFAFDLIPAKFITGFITEFGVIKPKNIRKMVKKKYPWLLRK
ncbi:MAG: S-methyl-5-thioribose-1-phosphate isomerase [Patescibacteria group bacterium]|jgi:ribose 1,5-bisphosphate isomerase